MANPQHPWTNVQHFDSVMKTLADKIMTYCKAAERGDVQIIHGNLEDGEVLFGFYYERAQGGESHGLQVHIEERGGRVGKAIMVDQKQRWWACDPPTPFSSGGMSRFLTILEGISSEWEVGTHGVAIATVAMPTVVPVTTYLYEMVGFPDSLITLRVGDEIPVAVSPAPGARLHYTLGFRGIEMEGDTLVVKAGGSGNFAISELPNAQNPDGVIIKVIDIMEEHPDGQVEIGFTGEVDGDLQVGNMTVVGAINPGALVETSIDWYSTNEAVATVASGGATDADVTAVAAGEAKIFGIIADGERAGDVTTYVTIKVTEVPVT